MTKPLRNFSPFHLALVVVALTVCSGITTGTFLLWHALKNDPSALWSDHAAAHDSPPSRQVPGSCTVFMMSVGGEVLFGNNEDYTNYNTFYWAEPSAKGKYGGVYLGYGDFFPQGGINEKGLTFDYTSLPGVVIKSHPERSLRKPEPDGRFEWTQPFKVMTIMRQAATVKEAIAVAELYDWSGNLEWQVLLTDPTGDAVIISAGKDGELAFTRKPPGDGFMVAANFNAANPANRYGPYPCPKATTATRQLKEMRAVSDLTVKNFRSILKAVHDEGAKFNTVYSNVIDVRRKKIYLYYWHQFGEAVELDVAAEIAKATRPVPLRTLFTTRTVKMAELRHTLYQKGLPPGRLVKTAGLAVLLAALVCGVVLFRKRVRGNARVAKD